MAARVEFKLALNYEVVQGKGKMMPLKQDTEAYPEPVQLCVYHQGPVRFPANMLDGDREKFAGFPDREDYHCMLRPIGRIYAFERSYLTRWNGDILPESTNPRLAQPLSARVRLRMLWRRLVALPFVSRWNEAVWVADRSSKSTYHLLTEALPKLYLLNRMACKLPVILPYRLRKNRLAMAAVSHFTDLRIEYLQPRRLGIIKNAWYVDYVAPISFRHFAHNGEVLAAMAAFYKQLFGVPDTKPANRIYISRQGSSRKIANAETIEPMLERAGFRTVFLEHMAFSEQVRTLSAASHIVSNHGAGLSNMMFSPAGATVIEFTNGEIPDFFFRLADALGHQYYYLNASVLRHKPDQPPVEGDLKVDPAALEKLLRQLGLL